MLHKCNGCGVTLTPKTNTPDPNIFFFTTYEFCESCYLKLEEQWRTALRGCRNDMNVFLKRQVEVADAFVQKGKKR